MEQAFPLRFWTLQACNQKLDGGKAWEEGCFEHVEKVGGCLVVVAQWQNMFDIQGFIKLPSKCFVHPPPTSPLST